MHVYKFNIYNAFIVESDCTVISKIIVTVDI